MKPVVIFALAVLIVVSGTAYGAKKQPHIPPARIADAGGVWAQAALWQGKVRILHTADAAEAPDGGICVVISTYDCMFGCKNDDDTEKSEVYRFDRNGKLLWTGVKGQDKTWLPAVTATPDNGCAATGHKNVKPRNLPADEDPSGAFFDFFIVKYGPDGKRDFYKQDSDIRHKTFGGRSIVSLNDGRVVVSGYKGSSIKDTPNCPWIIEFSPNGEVLRQSFDCKKEPREYLNMSIGGSGNIYTFENNEYESNFRKDPIDFFVCENRFTKLDATFNTILREYDPFREYGGMCLNDAVTDDVTGFATGFTNPLDKNEPRLPLLVKYTPDFSPVWVRTLDSEPFLIPWEVIATADGGALIGGNYTVRRNRHAPFAAQFSASGKLQWLKYYDPDIFTNLITVRESRSGGFIMLLNPNSSNYPDSCKDCPQFWLMKIDKNGNGPKKLMIDKPLILDE